ncbi:MAG: hypothetical protein ACLFN5_05755 [bacterium]
MCSSKPDIKKLMQLDIEAGEPPAPKNLSNIFEAALIEKTIKPDFLRHYLHSITPGLEDLSTAFQHLAEKNRDSISKEALEAISNGLDLMLLPNAQLSDTDSEEIYDRIVELIEDSPSSGNLEKYLLNTLLVISGSVLTAAAIPHIVHNHENYSKHIKNILTWIQSLFSE